MRFRKSISLGKGAKINLSKSGVGMSAGVKGLRVGAGPKGSYTSSGIPGTGVYSVNYSKSEKYSEDDAPIGFGMYVGIFLFIVGLLMLLIFWIFSLPMVWCWISIALGITFIILSSYNPSKKLEQKVLNLEQLVRSKKYNESLSLANTLLLKYPDNFRIIQILFLSLYSLNRFSEAEPYAEKLYSLAKDDNYANALTNIYIKQDKYDKAIPILQNHLGKINDDNELKAPLIVSLGTCFLEKGQYDLAIETFSQGPLQKRKLDETLLYLHYGLGVAYEKTGDSKNSKKHFEKVYSSNINFRDIKEKIIKAHNS